MGSTNTLTISVSFEKCHYQMGIKKREKKGGRRISFQLKKRGNIGAIWGRGVSQKRRLIFISPLMRDRLGGRGGGCRGGRRVTLAGVRLTLSFALSLALVSFSLVSVTGHWRVPVASWLSF